MKKILIVAQDVPCRNNLLAIVASLGASPLAVGTHDEALLALIQEGRFDAAVVVLYEGSDGHLTIEALAQFAGSHRCAKHIFAVLTGMSLSIPTQLVYQTLFATCERPWMETLAEALQAS